MNFDDSLEEYWGDEEPSQDEYSDIEIHEEKFMVEDTLWNDSNSVSPTKNFNIEEDSLLKNKYCLKQCSVELSRFSSESEASEINHTAYSTTIKSAVSVVPEFIDVSAEFSKEEFTDAPQSSILVENSVDEPYKTYDYSQLPTYAFSNWDISKETRYEEDPLYLELEETETASILSGNRNLKRMGKKEKKSLSPNTEKRDIVKKRESDRLRIHKQEIFETMQCVLAEEEKENPFVCSECNLTFRKMCKLVHHIKLVHLNLKPFICSKCDCCFGLRSQLYDHNISVHKVIILEGEKIMKQFKCPQCDSIFSSECKLLKHFRSIHGKFKPYRCIHCDKVFSEKLNLTNHIHSCHAYIKKSSSGETAKLNLRKVSCGENESIFLEDNEFNAINYDGSDSNIMKESYAQSANLPSFPTSLKCHICGSLFSREATLIRHMKVSHNLTRLNDKSSGNKDKIFSNKHNMLNHLESNKLNVSGPNQCVADDIRLSSEPTSKLFVPETKHNLRFKREVIHEDIIHKCGACQITFASESNLNIHIQLFHQGILFKCEKCEKAFCTKQLLLTHAQSSHQYRCPVCDSTFPRMCSAVKHVEVVHQIRNKEIRSIIITDDLIITDDPIITDDLIENKLHPCPYCRKTFKDELKLSNHHSQRIKNVKNHKCQVCNRIFCLKRTLKRHIEAIHAKIKYKCNFCLKSFTQPSSLLTHKRFYHSNVVNAHNLYDSNDRSDKSCNLVTNAKVELNHNLTDFKFINGDSSSSYIVQAAVSSKSKFKTNASSNDDILQTALSPRNKAKIGAQSRSTVQSLVSSQDQIKIDASVRSDIIPVNKSVAAISSQTITKCSVSFKGKREAAIASGNQCLNFKCTYCDLILGKKSMLAKHILSVHKKRKRKCLKCHKAFGLKSELSDHIERVHSKLQSIECTECNFFFIKESHLLIHCKNVHGRES